MKRTILWVLAAVTGLSLLSCERKEMDTVTNVVSDSDVLYATIDQGSTETKAYVDENYKVLWHADDHISAFMHSTFNRDYRFLGQTGDNYGRFEKVPDDALSAANPLDHIYAIYPYKDANRVTNAGVMVVDLPSVQPYEKNSFAQGINTMVAVSDENELFFKNACGYLGVKLYGENIGVSSIVLEGNDGELIAGQAEIRMEPDGAPELSMIDKADENQKQITLTSRPFVLLGATEEDYTEFWIVLPPMTFEHGLTVTVWGAEGGSFVKSTEESITIERSRITHLKPVCVSDLPQLTDPLSHIIIDGQFDDWDALVDPNLVAVAYNQPKSPKKALKVVKLYATEAYIYVYFEYDPNAIDTADLLKWGGVPFHCYINTDGDTTTGGYADMFTDACSDVLLEGYLYKNRKNNSYNPAIYPWTGETNGSGWEWGWWIINNDGGMGRGTGISGKYEFLLDRSKFEAAGYPVADHFSIGFDIQKDWDAIGVLPNATPSADNLSGHAPSLQYPPSGEVVLPPEPEVGEEDYSEIVGYNKYNVAFQELSGLCLAGDGSFWGVGDNGQLGHITLADGQMTVENGDGMSGYDTEGITIDPTTGDLYVCAEPDFVLRTSFPYTEQTDLFRVADASNYGNYGLEGITWYKDNTLYVGSQAYCELWCYDLEGNVLDHISLKDVCKDITEIAGLCYDPINDWLWVTDSEIYTLFVFSGNARNYLGRYTLPFYINNEGICVDHARGCVWVADDYGDYISHIYRLDIPGINQTL